MYPPLAQEAAPPQACILIIYLLIYVEDSKSSSREHGVEEIHGVSRTQVYCILHSPLCTKLPLDFSEGDMGWEFLAIIIL